MAKNKSRRSQPSKRKRNVRVAQLHSSIAMRPRRSLIPADPPTRSMTLEQSSVIRLHLYDQAADKAARLTTSGRYTPAHLYATHGHDYFELTASNIITLIMDYSLLSSSTDLEFAIRKVSVWGPIPKPGDSEAYPCLAVDVSAISAGLTVNDRSAPNHRSRCGIALPFVVWHGTSSSVLIRYKPNGTSLSPISIMDLSLVWRLSQKL